jgi:signal transduction histidine kinase
MRPPRLESRIRLLIVCFAALIILVVSGIGWIILSDAEDAIHDRYFIKTAEDIVTDRSGATLPAGVTAHADASFLMEKMRLHEIPSAPGLYEIFANDDLTRSVVVRTFFDRLQLWIILGYEREFRLWIAPEECTGNIRVVLADLSTTELSEAETDKARERLLILSALLFLLALGIGQLISQWALKPVRELTRRVLHDRADTQASLLHKDFPSDEIGQLASALDEYRQRLEAALLRERHFLSDCSHELRTPIATLKSALDLLDQAADNAISRDRITERMRRSAQRMERLVRTFLLLARERRPPVSAGSVNIEKIVRSVVDELSALHLEHPLKITIQSDREVMHEIDTETLTVLCHNLIENAYLHVGGGLLEITIRTNAESVSLVFQDDGPGFPELPGPTVPGGYGIGLSLVERLCKACGWTFIRGSGQRGGARLEVGIPITPIYPPPGPTLGTYKEF